MWSWLVFGVGGLLLVGVVLWLLLVISMRTKFSPFLTAVRRINRVLSNPRAMRMAGRPGAYASVVHHVGRSTGTPYRTPVGVVHTEGGVVIALPYGTSADWLKNVVAAGRATIVSEGNTLLAEYPEVVPAAAVGHHFSIKDRMVHRLYGVDQFLVLRRVGPG